MCVSVGRGGVGTVALLPGGALLETPARWAEVQLVVINGDGWTHAGALQMRLRPAPLRRLVDDEQQTMATLRGQRIHAVAGIGDPSRFFASLIAGGLEIQPHPFADHHAYRAEDFFFGDAAPIVKTGRASCRERVCQYVLNSVGAGSLHYKTKSTNTTKL